MKATLLCQHPIERKWQFPFNVLHGAESRLAKILYGWGCVAALSPAGLVTPSPPYLLLGLLHCFVRLLRCSVLCHVYMMLHCIASGIGHESGALVLKWDK
jgi:hypothetical protein